LAGYAVISKIPKKRQEDFSKKLIVRKGFMLASFGGVNCARTVQFVARGKREVSRVAILTKYEGACISPM